MSILGGNCNKSQFLPKVNQLLINPGSKDVHFYYKKYD